MQTITINLAESADFDVLNSEVCQRYYMAQVRHNLFRRIAQVINDQPGEHTIKLKTGRTRKGHTYTYAATALVTIEGATDGS